MYKNEFAFRYGLYITITRVFVVLIVCFFTFVAIFNKRGMAESRLHKSILNAKVNLIFYFITLFLSFFSRKIFLDCLGNDFVGLVGTLGNLLDFLNLAELGIGAAIGAVLYKPLFDGDRVKINEIILVFGFFYRKVGLVILLGGVLLSCFLPLIFGETGFDMSLVYFAFYSFLLSALIGYFANYKQTLLGADQRNYVVTAYFQTSNLVKTLIQILLAYYTHNYYYWVLIELCFGVIYSVILNWKIRQVYPWLRSEVKNGKLLRQKYPLIMQYSKQLFIHKIGSLVQFQIKPLLIYSFVSLQVVAFYGNYALIVDKVALLIKNVLGSTGAGVGNLVAEGDKEKIQKIFWELTSLNYFIAGVLVFSIYYLIEPFITLWVGSEYVLSKWVLIIILCNMFIMQTRSTNDQFLFAYGLFNDVWAPVVEVILSVLISLIGGYFWGLEGVLLGSVVSMFFIVVLWKPYFLYRKGFKDNLSVYWIRIAKYLLLILVAWFLCWILMDFVSIDPYEGYWDWVKYSSMVVVLLGGILVILFYSFTSGFQFFVSRIIKKINSR